MPRDTPRTLESALRVAAFTAGFILAVAMTTAAMAAPAPAKGGQCKTVCAPPPAPPPAATGGLCKVICAPPSAPVAQAKPKPVAKRAAVTPHAVRHAPVRRATRHRAHHYAERRAPRDYYTYHAEAGRQAEAGREEWRDAWHQAPNDAVIGGPPPYGPPPPAYGGRSSYYAEGYAQDDRSYQGDSGCDCTAGQAGLEIDRYGWTGGVGNAGASEVFVDGYGMVHYGSRRSLNGPTYNSYSQSFPYNPSRATPFQPRVMGGFAGRGASMSGGYGPHR